MPAAKSCLWYFHFSFHIANWKCAPATECFRRLNQKIALLMQNTWKIDSTLEERSLVSAFFFCECYYQVFGYNETKNRNLGHKSIGRFECISVLIMESKRCSHRNPIAVEKKIVHSKKPFFNEEKNGSGKKDQFHKNNLKLRSISLVGWISNLFIK